MPTNEEWIECNREALAVARREGDHERETACLAELAHLGAPEATVKTPAPERATKSAAKPRKRKG